MKTQNKEETQRGKNGKGKAEKKWKICLLRKWWINVKPISLQAVSLPGNNTRHRHSYQDDRSLLPLGLKQEHFVLQEQWIFGISLWLLIFTFLFINDLDFYQGVLFLENIFFYWFIICIIIMTFLLNSSKSNKHCEKYNVSSSELL